MNARKMSVKDMASVAGLVATVLGVCLVVWFYTARQTVWLLNGLSGTLLISVDGAAPHTVQPGDHVDVSVSVGAHDMRVTSLGGKLIAEDSVVVPGRQDVVAYNPLGASGVYAAAVVYVPKGSPQQAPPPPEFFGGKRLITRGSVDYVFRQPPDTISVKGGGTHTRWFVDVLPGGWQESLHRAQSRGDDEDALQICKAALAVRPKDEEPADCVVTQAALLHGFEAGRKAAVELLAQQPRNASLHRTYQYVMREMDRSADLQAEYAALHEKDPQDALFTALYGRTLTGPAALAVFKNALSGDGERVAMRGLATGLLAEGRAAESLAYYTQMAQADPDYPRYADDHARALIMTGKAREALAIATAMANAKKAEWPSATLVAEVVRAGHLKGEDGLQFVNSMGKKDDVLLAYMLSRLGEDPGKAMAKISDVMKRVIMIHVAAAHDPAEAWRHCQDLPPGTLRQMNPTVALLLASEFSRVGDETTAAPLFRQALRTGVPLGALRAYVQEGTDHPDLWRLDVDERAALDLVRARTLEGEGRDASALRAALRKRVLMDGVVAHAVEQWPRITTTSTLVALHRNPI